MKLKNCKAAFSSYAKKWAKEVCVDKLVHRDWEEKVQTFIDEKMRCLKQRQATK